MKSIITMLGRFAAIGSAAFGLATFANYYNHKGYWEGTINRVQTVDFNILSNMLPTKLPYALQASDGEEIQRTLDSNYGLFGLVVTDCTATADLCPNEQVLFATQSDRLWDGAPNPEQLLDQPYSLLKNPPPLTAENGYENSRDTTWDPTNRVNPGQVIGRVYYVRSSPPEFWPSYWRWIGRWPGSLLSDSGASKYYALTVSVFMAGGIAAWGILEGVCYQKRIQEQLAQQKQSATRRDIQRLQNRMEERVAFTNKLIAERRELLHELQEHRDQERVRLQEMKDVAAQQQQLLQTKLEALNKLQREQAQSSQNNSISPELKQAIARLQQETKAAQGKVLSAQQEVERLQAHEESANQRIQNLSQLNEGLKREAEEYSKKLQWMQVQLNHAQRKSDEYQQLVNESQKMPLNPFEQKLLKMLNESDRVQSGQWRILEQVDVSHYNDFSQFTDFIVLTAYGAFILEAKHYLGEIKPVGSVKNTQWRYVKGQKGSSGVVQSSGGCNPYAQVSNYCHSLMSMLNRRLRMKQKRAEVSAFGIVVFPDGATYPRIGNRITKYCRVTTLSKLIELIERLEDNEREKAKENSSSPVRLTPSQLEALILGKPIPSSDNPLSKPGQVNVDLTDEPDYPQAS